MKSKFFCIIISFATLLPTIPVYSQNSWITEIPGDTQSIEMIRSADSCFVVLGYPSNFSRTKINLTKVSRSGEIMWQKTYESDMGIFAYLNLIQLNNGNYFITGKLDWKPYAAMFDQFGDSIWTKRYDGYSIEGCFYNPIEVNDNEVWVSGGYDTLYVTKINQVGNLHIDSTLITTRPFMRLYHNNNLLFLTGDLTCVSNFYLTDTNLNIIAHKNCRFNVLSNVKVRQHDDKYYFYGYSNATYPMTYGFLVLNSELDSIAYIPDSIYYPFAYETWSVSAYINDFIFTNDNRIALCGQVHYAVPYYPLLIITDFDYHPELTLMYGYSGEPQEGVNLFQEGDGYVMLQHRYEEPRCSFVVKTNSDGSVGNETATIERNFLRVYPNPFQDELNISVVGNENIESVAVYDLSGRLVYF